MAHHSQAGRLNLLPAIQAVFNWCIAQEQLPLKTEVGERIARRHGELRVELESLDSGVACPSEREADLFVVAARRLDEQVEVAKLASQAWHHREQRKQCAVQMVDLITRWFNVHSQYPLVRIWSERAGGEIISALRFVLENQSSAAAAALWMQMDNSAWHTLSESWSFLASEYAEVKRLSAYLLKDILPESHFVEEWWRSGPERSFVSMPNSFDQWPVTEPMNELLNLLRVICGEFQQFTNEREPAQRAFACEEQEYAITQLRESAQMIPEESVRRDLGALIENFQTAADNLWEEDRINTLLGEYDPQRIGELLNRLNIQMRDLWLQGAKYDWLERNRRNQQTVQAIHTLRDRLDHGHGRIADVDHVVFGDALAGASLWITTCPCPQSLPLVPDLFDLVVIDEASQCTVTNILPFAYRAKSLVVIGDNKQLPAIPSVTEAEEVAMAQNRGLTPEETNLLAHSLGRRKWNAYSAVEQALPLRAAGTLMLLEHFRSNPAIIGFSNRWIYNSYLLLKKYPSAQNELPFARGVHAKNIAGQAQRGVTGKSWFNQREAEAVAEKVRELAQLTNQSIGVVTPFRAQKERIVGLLGALIVQHRILVDVVHSFQGDERDIMLYSPVVSPPMLHGIIEWVHPEFLFWCGALLRSSPGVMPVFAAALRAQAAQEKVSVPENAGAWESVAVEWLLQGLVKVPPCELRAETATL